MKKISYLVLSIIFLFTLPTATKGKETYSPIIYATIEQGSKLTPDSFIPMLESAENTNISTIEFSNSSRGNTMTSGIFKTSVDFTDTSKKKQTTKVSYLVYPKEPSISFNSINYNPKSKELDVLLNDSAAAVYLLTEQQNYNLPLDDNGHFRGKYNPDKLPTEITFLALEDNGHWSAMNVLDIKTKQVKTINTPLTALEYNELVTHAKSLKPSNQQKTKLTRTLIITLVLITSIIALSYYYGKMKKQN